MKTPTLAIFIAVSSLTLLLQLGFVQSLSLQPTSFSQLNRHRGHYQYSASTRTIISSTTTRLSQSKNSFREDALSQELKEVETDFGLTQDEQIQIAPPPPEPYPSKRPPMKIRDGAAIIAGTAVGGGFLALPSFTAPVGYLPTVVGLVSSWAFLVFAAIAFCEAAALQADCARLETDTEVHGTSVASVIKFAFGRKWALLAGGGFLAQMVAVMTANVVKGAELVAHSTGLPYPVACIVPATLIGAFTFGSSRPERVEQVNTAMTVLMVGGFATLIATTFGAGHAAGKAGLFSSLLNNANWSRLLPTTKSAWAFPIFVKLLAFGEAMPLIVERMALAKNETTTTTNGSKNNNNGDTAASSNTIATTMQEKMMGFNKIRMATVLGAGIPLLLAIIWAGISVALIEPSSPNPMLSLLAYGPSIAWPVLLLAYGAIGTTLLGAFLAMGHFCQDMICSKLGYCSLQWMNVASVLTVAAPCSLALMGSNLYLPLLAFAGAYPTTLLYGLAPSLAAMTLRKRAQKSLDSLTAKTNGETGDAMPEDLTITPHLVPGGKRTLVALAATALGLVGANTLRFGRFLVQAMAP